MEEFTIHELVKAALRESRDEQGKLLQIAFALDPTDAMCVLRVLCESLTWPDVPFEVVPALIRARQELERAMSTTPVMVEVCRRIRALTATKVN